MRTYAELKEADFQEMTKDEDSFVKRIRNLLGYHNHCKNDANMYMEKVIELDKENGSTFIRELFFANLKETFAKHEKAGRLSPEAIEAIKDWRKIEESFDSYIEASESMIDYSTIVIVLADASLFDLCWKDSDLIMNAWMILDFGIDYTIDLDKMRYGYIH